jgi:acetyl-CoA carboxylase biotin carboxyl carrier protein
VTADGPIVDPAELLALIDRLEALLEAGGISEIEIEAAGLGLVLRSQAAVGPPPAPLAAGPATPPAAPAAAVREPSQMLAVLAPLTGLYYSAPSPGAEPYVRVGREVHVGQVIGLIEAMKLFNEIKSDIAGRVVRVCVEDGGLVKAKQPLVELEPI